METLDQLIAISLQKLPPGGALYGKIVHNF